jgi:hypothetical protein
MNDNEDTATSAIRLATLIHSLSSTLGNIDLEHKGELERLALSTVEGDFAAVIMATLQKRHQQRREPYVRHLEELRERARQDVLCKQWNNRTVKLVAAE